MRFLAAALVALSLTACLGNPGEPLGSFGDERVNEARTQRDVVSADGIVVRDLAARSIFEGTEAAPVDDFQQQVIAEVAATIDYASLQAFAVADAGSFRDRTTASAAAVELATAAGLVQQRANEMRALSSTAGSGDCGSEPVVEGELPEGVNDAVVLSALAAELGGEIADQLDPPSEMVCGAGCGATCEEVPGTVDEEVLALAIEGALDAAQDCADLGVELGDVNVL